MVMNARIFKFLIAISVAYLGGCSSNVRRDNDAPAVYQYSGAKYGKVSTAMSPAIAADADKAARFQELKLEEAIVTQLKEKNLYDEKSENIVDVVVNALRVRNAATAIMFGFMAGSDNMEGVVTLKASDGKVLNKFTIDASYALGGFGGGQNTARLGYLSRTFGELTAKTILDKK